MSEKSGKVTSTPNGENTQTTGVGVVKKTKNQRIPLFFNGEYMASIEYDTVPDPDSAIEDAIEWLQAQYYEVQDARMGKGPYGVPAVYCTGVSLSR